MCSKKRSIIHLTSRSAVPLCVVPAWSHSQNFTFNPGFFSPRLEKPSTASLSHLKMRPRAEIHFQMSSDRWSILKRCSLWINSKPNKDIYLHLVVFKAGLRYLQSPTGIPQVGWRSWHPGWRAPVPVQRASLFGHLSWRKISPDILPS